MNSLSTLIPTGLIPAGLLADPPPAFAFELSETGIAFARVGGTPQVQFQPFSTPLISVSPVRDNIHDADGLAACILGLLPPGGARKKRVALIVPDYCARVAVLDFDAFPADTEEQLALVRFRMKKSVPFDIESAMVNYYAQSRAGNGGKIDVVVAVMAHEIVTRYETPFRAASLQPGYVTTSSLAMLNLVTPSGLTLVARRSSHTLTVMVLDDSTLKLVRCIETEEGSPGEMEAVLLPTMAYIEDELKAAPQRLLLCGFGPETEELGRNWSEQWGLTVERLRSRFGAPGPADAGLYGYLESLD
jgi:type IV pilus assembly protein PilM